MVGENSKRGNKKQKQIHVIALCLRSEIVTEYDENILLIFPNAAKHEWIESIHKPCEEQLKI